MGSAAGGALLRFHCQRQLNLNRATIRAGLADCKVAVNTDERPDVPLALERRILGRTGHKAARPARNASFWLRANGSRRVRSASSMKSSMTEALTAT